MEQLVKRSKIKHFGIHFCIYRHHQECSEGGTWLLISRGHWVWIAFIFCDRAWLLRYPGPSCKRSLDLIPMGLPGKIKGERKVVSSPPWPRVQTRPVALRCTPSALSLPPSSCFLSLSACPFNKAQRKEKRVLIATKKKVKYNNR